MNNLLNKLFCKLLSNNKFQALYPYLPDIPKKELSEKEWEERGKPVPPPHIIKEKIIMEYQKTNQYKVFVETGTYLGEMVKAQRDTFEEIYSIELSTMLYNRARRRFKRYKHIKILNGDCGKVLRNIVPTINKNAIFWLDAHYSEGITARGDTDCPIFEELQSILKSKFNHIILIDDARLFNGTNDYPTIEKLSTFVLAYKNKSDIKIKDDVIRIILK